MKNSVKFRKNIAVINTAYEKMITDVKIFKSKADRFFETSGMGISVLGIEAPYFSSNYLMRGYGEIHRDVFDSLCSEEISEFLEDLIIDIDHFENDFSEAKNNLASVARTTEGWNVVYGALCSLLSSYRAYVVELKKFSCLSNYDYPVIRLDVEANNNWATDVPLGIPNFNFRVPEELYDEDKDPEEVYDEIVEDIMDNVDVVSQKIVPFYNRTVQRPDVTVTSDYYAEFVFRGHLIVVETSYIRDLEGNYGENKYEILEAIEAYKVSEE